MNYKGKLRKHTIETYSLYAWIPWARTVKFKDRKKHASKYACRKKYEDEQY